MTDNEKRAHDLAISYYKEFMNVTVNEAAHKAIENGETTITVPVDVYKAYKNLYDLVLAGLNRDYPDGL